jgi:hypothetical protein
MREAAVPTSSRICVAKKVHRMPTRRVAKMSTSSRDWTEKPAHTVRQKTTIWNSFSIGKA